MEEKKKKPGVSKRRAVVLAALVLVIFAAFAVRLYTVQIVRHDDYSEQAKRSSTLTLTTAASRGEILDRNLSPLVVNRTAYTVVLDYNFFPRAADERQNEVLAALCRLLEIQGEEWNDTLPITKTCPHEFEEDRESSVATLKESLGLSQEASAAEVMAALVHKYKLENYSPEEQRVLAGVQNEMALRGFSTVTPYIFAFGVSKETTYLISENADRFVGVILGPPPHGNMCAAPPPPT